jgi:tetratricopeptide (TPR) repeat protein
VEVNPSNHIAHSNFGGELYRAGKIEPAVQHFIQALLTNPDYADAQNNLLTSLERARGRNNVTTALKRLSNLYPDNPVFYFLMGDLAYEGRDAQSTINYYRKSLDIDPGFIQALNALGRTYVELGEFELALTILKKRAKLGQTNSAIYYDMARCYAHLGERELALMALRKAAGSGFNSWHFLLQDPVMADLRSDPVLRKLIGGQK